MGEFVTRNVLGSFEKINKRKICCILLVVYSVNSSVLFCGCCNEKSAESYCNFIYYVS